MTGELSERNILRDSELKGSTKDVAKEIGMLFVFGIAAAILKAYTRDPIGLPGHEWVIWMVLLVIGRAASPYRFAGSVMGVGASAASYIPALGANDPFIAFYFLIPAFVFDILYVPLKSFKIRSVVIVLLSGLALGIKAVTQYVIYMAAGLHWGAAKTGIAYPILLHVGFGLAGGLIGVAVLKSIEFRRKSMID